MIALTIPGKPQGKARPRFNSATRTTYTPKQTQNYEDLVRACYNQKYAFQKEELAGEIVAKITAFFPIPRSTRKSDKELMIAGILRPTTKPDIDNVIKAVLDALNGYAYKDDSAVVKVIAEKRYSENPRVEVMLANGGAQQ